MATIDVGETCEKCGVRYFSQYFGEIKCGIRCTIRWNRTPGRDCPGPGTYRLVDVDAVVLTDAEYQQLLTSAAELSSKLDMLEPHIMENARRLSQAVILDPAKCTPEAIRKWTEENAYHDANKRLFMEVILDFLAHAGVVK